MLSKDTKKKIITTIVWLTLIITDFAGVGLSLVLKQQSQLGQDIFFRAGAILLLTLLLILSIFFLLNNFLDPINKLGEMSGRLNNYYFNLEKDLEKFTFALDYISDAIIIISNTGRIVYVNNGTERLLGYSSQELLGTRAGQVWGQSMGEDYFTKIGTALMKDNRPFFGTMTGQRKNGQKFDASIIISPVFGYDKMIDYFACVERDITQEKQIDKAKTDLVSLASHQLRTPLSGINWYTEMLLSGDAGELNEEQKDFVKEIKRGTQRMVDLVNTLLTITSLELKKFAIKPAPENIQAICDSVLSECSQLIEQRQLVVTKDYAADLPLVKVDARLMRLILQNLLSNAAYYTPDKGKIGIAISLNRRDISIVVSDSGYGIPDKQQGRIFEKLFRADNIKAKNVDGAGLGLYMVRSILEIAGGSISFQSRENQGTEFTVTIPLKGMKKKGSEKSLA